MVLIVASECFMVKVGLSGRVRGTMSVWLLLEFFVGEVEVWVSVSMRVMVKVRAIRKKL